ncbi:hypothetical protein CHLNCDRAFT_55198 [Chlorella variabilis]|uniref:tRNA dimethylallyltransferase n=1 Tax=Chlorella variabilis TaxID=554065 RepID=E1ZS74_CHLVA|nr:hypothetical protein CHLNCDRAFT_55198 [Chlorella variabilis]EFN51365.1 hypothetical protein CHLNCDRAFT_55198 [Chlorella variabilis]|eukprot:XP_005843467.1 hypothetical protein CHLNCDRAFT_55198 [Chlorella variabilis]
MLGCARKGLVLVPHSRLNALRALAARQRRAMAGNTSAAATAASDAPCRPKVLILTGPTAVGKTKASLALAEALGGEIISADSVQVYRGLDIGSDKISAAERRGIPHHLLDVLDPHQDFSAGDFFVRARAAADDILQRGKTPIVAGGTGFYLRWFILGKPSTPPASPASEAAATQRLEQVLSWGGEAYAATEAAAGRPLSVGERWEAGAALVAALGDEESAARLRREPNNQYRLLRIVDILLQSGGRPLADQDLDAGTPTHYDCRCFFLHRPRLELYRRIDGRVEEMVAAGLLQECQLLLEAGVAPSSNCASRAIGYRQALDFLRRCHDDPQAHATEAGVIQLVKAIQTASRQLCHRQMSWFRDEGMFRWVDATAGEEAVLAEVLERWHQPQHEGGCGDGGRLTKEQAEEMKRYVPKLRLYFSGSDAMQRTLAELRQLLQRHKEWQAAQAQAQAQQQEERQQEGEAGAAGGEGQAAEAVSAVAANTAAPPP